jgi:hypothetical protein
MKFFSKRFTALVPGTLGSALLCSCAVVDTGANVVKAGASLVGTTVGAATTAAGVVVTTAGVAATTAGAAKTVAVNTANVAVAGTSTAIAAGALVVSAASAAAASRRADDISTATVVAIAPDRFSTAEGRVWITQNCADVAAGRPGLWVAMRSGDSEIRVTEGSSCRVIASQ